jgi:hypothetical protein
MDGLGAGCAMDPPIKSDQVGGWQRWNRLRRRKIGGIFADRHHHLQRLAAADLQIVMAALVRRR